MRAFIAIPLPAALRAELAAFAAEAAAPLSGRPVPAANLHATVHFLGSVSDGDREELAAALAAACASVAPFVIHLSGAALAPPRRPRMIWARLDAPAGLAALAQAVAAAAQPFAPDARAPRTGNPHVTLARLHRPPRRGADVPAIPAAGTEIPVAACELVRSELGPGGSRYTTLAELPLGAA